jgi:dienelactone hydrolase
MSHVAVTIPINRDQLGADLAVPDHATGLVIFAHGSGSSRHSPRNQAVARALEARGLATLLADLLTPAEEVEDRIGARLRFDIDLLSDRVVTLIDWAARQSSTRALPIGLFGASTGAAAALVAAAVRPANVRAIVSRGGRADLAGDALPRVSAPTLLLVGRLDAEVLSLNQRAKARMQAPVSLQIVAGASHLFEEPGTLDEVATRAGDFFIENLRDPQRDA